MPVVSALLLFMSCWLTGYIVYLWISGEKLVLPRYQVFFLGVLAVVFLSVIFSLYQYHSIIPHWNKTVAVLFSGKKVLLKNAIGWILLGLVQWSAGPLFFVYIYDWLKRYNESDRIIRCLSAGILLSICIAVYQKFFHTGFGDTLGFSKREGRVNGGCFEHNAFAYMLYLSTVLLITAFIKTQNKQRYLFLGGLVLAVFALYLSGIRAALAGTIAVCIISMVLMLWEKDLRTRYLLPFTLFLVIIILYAFLPLPTSGRLSQLGKNIHKSSSPFTVINQERGPYWKVGIHITEKYLPLGTGVGRYLLVLPDFLRSSHLKIWTTNENTCNYYIQIAAEMGLIGVLMFGLMLINVFSQVLNTLNLERYTGTDKRIIAISIAIMLVLLMTWPHLQDLEVSLLFWTLVAMIWEDAC